MVQGHTVPHLKALMCGKMEPSGLRCGGIFILCYALLKIALLLHTEGFVKFHSGRTVIHSRGGSHITFAIIGGWVVKNLEKLQTL